MQETWVPSLGGEDPLEKEMATHCRILAWEIPWTEEPGRLQFVGLQKRRTRFGNETTLTNDAVYFFMCYWPFVYLPWRNI